MTHQLMKLSELGQLLDYSDSRSIESWCNRNNVPIMIMGKQKYTLPVFVDQYFQRYVKKYVTANFKNSDAIMDAIEANDSIRLSELMEIPIPELVKRNYLNELEHSRAGKEFLKNIKKT